MSRESTSLCEQQRQKASASWPVPSAQTARTSEGHARGPVEIAGGGQLTGYSSSPVILRYERCCSTKVPLSSQRRGQKRRAAAGERKAEEAARNKTPRIHIDEVRDRVLPGPGMRDSSAATNSTSASSASTPSGGLAMLPDGLPFNDAPSALHTMHSIEDGYDASLKSALELCRQMGSLVTLPARARSKT